MMASSFFVASAQYSLYFVVLGGKSRRRRARRKDRCLPDDRAFRLYGRPISSAGWSCCTHRVRVQQKDIMLHDEYHDELKERLGRDDVVVPQVFVNGHHVGVSEMFT